MATRGAYEHLKIPFSRKMDESLQASLFENGEE
jgi:hypothetical protein